MRCSPCRAGEASAASGAGLGSGAGRARIGCRSAPGRAEGMMMSAVMSSLCSHKGMTMSAVMSSLRSHKGMVTSAVTSSLRSRRRWLGNAGPCAAGSCGGTGASVIPKGAQVFFFTSLYSRVVVYFTFILPTFWTI